MSLLLAELGDQDAKIRSRASNELVRAGDVALPTLVQALCDSNPLTRSAASGALCRIGKHSVPTLVRFIRARLKSQSPIPIAALWTLGLLLGRDTYELAQLVEWFTGQSLTSQTETVDWLLTVWMNDDI